MNRPSAPSPLYPRAKAARRWVHRPALVLAFLAAVFAPQAAAIAAQFAEGFRPFRKEPVRVPLSWDMFAVRIERCDVAWSPPLRLGGGVASLHSLAPPFEWNISWSSREGYRRAGLDGCRFAAPNTRVTLRCFTPEGDRIDDVFACP